MPWRRFIVADVIAGVLWGSYAALLGFIGGSQFEDAPWKGLLVAVAVAVAVSALVEFIRWLRHRRPEVCSLQDDPAGN